MTAKNQVAKLEGEKMNNSPAVAPADKLRGQIVERKGEFLKVLPSHISFEEFQRVIMTACIQNPDLITADRQSLLLSAVKAATDGLLPDGREGAFVIFNRNVGTKQAPKWIQLVQWMPMYFGILKKVRQSKEIASVCAHIAYEADQTKGVFRVVLGDEEKIEHEPYMGKDRGEIIAAYAIAKLADGSTVREVMTFEEIEKVRRTSKSGDKEGSPAGVWKEWYGEMARKTVFRRLSKWLPQSKEIIERAFQNDDSMAGTFDMEANAPTSEKPLTITEQNNLQITDESGQPDLGQMIDESKRNEENKEAVRIDAEIKKPEQKAEEKPQPDEGMTILDKLVNAIQNAKDGDELDAIWNVEWRDEIAGLSKEDHDIASKAYSEKFKQV